jgi:hypothetical protein
MRPSVVTLVVLAAVATRPLDAQVLASERASVSQTVNGATITVEYYRPAVRGREIFGKLVHWGETWTPGANWATTLETDRDLRIEGQSLPKGKYSVWIKTAKEGAWSVGFARTPRLFHSAVPRDTAFVLRVPVLPQAAPATERLTWSFPEIARDSTVLRLAWASMAVPLHIGFVRPAAKTLPATTAAAYVGRYRMKFEGDTTTFGLRVHAVRDGLEAVMDSVMAPPDLGPRLALVPADSAHQFLWGTFQKGQYIGVEENLFFLFTMVDGRATEVRMKESVSGSVFATGTVLPEPPARRRR